MPMKHPNVRLRRLRENPGLRRMLGEHRLMTGELVQPLFVKEGLTKPAAIASMPGQFQFSEKTVIEEARKVHGLGIPAVILFGIPAKKDASGRAASAANGLMQRVIRSLKKECPGLIVIADVCLCEYLSHGHCGHIENGRVLNDASVKTLASIALSYAQAGADAVAPSDMMDGRVAAIRRVLDGKKFEQLPIISYAVKYASGFYAPFREAAESTPSFGDRSSYQMNPGNALEALREAETDLAEGADVILVKPAFAYNDIVYRVRERFSCPVGCFSVSGEYAMIKAAAEKKWIDEKKIVLETHLAMKRAGASFIITYWAKDIARWEKK